MATKYERFTILVDFTQPDRFNGVLYSVKPAVEASTEISVDVPVEELHPAATTLSQHRIGFNNAGNQCYKSASLQMLSHIPEFITLILNSKDTTPPIPNLHDLFTEIDTTKLTSITPEDVPSEKALPINDLKQRLGCLTNTGVEEDAEEFLTRCIFGRITEPNIKKLFEFSSTKTLYTDNTCAKKYIPESGKTNPEQTQKYFILQVPLETSNTIQECISLYRTCEKLEDANKIREHPNVVSVKETPSQTGPYCIIQLKRFKTMFDKATKT